MASNHRTKFKKTARNLNEVENTSFNSSKQNIFKLKQKQKRNLSVRKKIESEEHDRLDSLKFLKGNEKLNDLDNKIKLLKLELRSMLGSTSENKSSICNEHKKEGASDKLDLNLSMRESFVKEKGEILDISSFISCPRAKSTNNSLSQDLSKYSNGYSPVTFSEWLSSTIDLIDSQTKNSNKNKNKSVCGNKIKNLDSLHKNPTTLSNCLNGGFKPSKISKLKPEKLLYESFLMKNLEKYLSSSDESTPDQKGLTSRLKRQQLKCKKKLSQKPSQKNKEKRISQKKVKKNRVSQTFSDNSVEMLSVDPSHSVLETSKKLNGDVIDLDLKNLNWDEPFDLDENDSSTLSNLDAVESDCEVIYISPSRQISDDGKEKEANEKIEKNKVVKKNFWECPICFEQSTDQEIVTTLCGHVYCKQCLETYLSTTTKSCPCCCTDLSGKSFITLFNF